MKRLWSISALFLLLGPCALAQAPQENQDGQVPQTETQTQTLTLDDVKKQATKPDAVFTLDQLLARLTNTSDKAQAKLIAEEVEARFQNSGSASIDLLLQRGIAAQKRGELSLAGDFYADLTELAPDFAAGWNQRATLEFQQGMVQAALDDLAHALDLQPKNYVALTNLGNILERMQQAPAALKAYQDALAIYPFYEPAQKGHERLEKAVQGRQL